MEHLIEDIYKEYNGSLASLCDNGLTDLTDKGGASGFSDLSENAKAASLNEAEKFLDFEFPYIPLSLFMDFKKTGNRTDFENVYFLKRRALNSLIIGECIERKNRFLKDILNGLYSILDEYAWQLPAHNTYVRDTPQLPLADTSDPILDLFACETGALIATAYRLLKDDFDKISPFINKRILSNLKSRIIDPYLNRHFWWMGKGNEPMCNWTIWCTQNILITTSSIPLDGQIYKKVIDRAVPSFDYFLKEYGNDGCCDEGAQYYHHAGLCLGLALELIDRICNGFFRDVFNNAKIINIAEYICNMHVSDKYFINYADCSPVAGRGGVREFLFGKAVSSNALMNFASRDFLKNEDPYLFNEINLYYRLLTLFHEKEVSSYASGLSDEIPTGNVWYESVGIFIARNKDVCLSMKAGDNDDSHNHNDTGSPILYIKGQPALIDVGVESYTKKTFSPERYEIWSMQSGYHNLPTIGGLDQAAGKEYKASDVCVYLRGLHSDSSYSYDTSLSDSASLEKIVDNSGFDPSFWEPYYENCIGAIGMDISGAYPKESGIRKYIRTVILANDGSMILADDHEFEPDAKNTSLVYNFMTYEKPEIVSNDPGPLVLSKKLLKKDTSSVTVILGEICTLTLTGCESVDIETIHIDDERLKITWKHDIYRIRITGKEEGFTLTCQS
jgi:hypothetical protein